MPDRPTEKPEDKPQVERKGTPPEPGRRTETDPALNNPEATPGSGMLPEIGSDDPDMQPSG